MRARQAVRAGWMRALFLPSPAETFPLRLSFLHPLVEPFSKQACCTWGVGVCLVLAKEGEAEPESCGG